ncbi:acyl-CoA thioesterase (plasmid) [Paracoccus versutus]|uniref:Acyl-CoA hydrolase n=1 Tax=Paracoccus versutus TaxID=34007 RepID=A0AAQ0HK75_PARVE|nr:MULTISPECIES: acyl-CoA thioesterase [Paracoccus]WGR62327.1 acyl-CoA thioesterase [Paracoccus ferrooxidans]SFX35930.1 Acyl-CoA hydrolase [Paracoccus pantotrophus]KGJ10590.1 thioesterase [Paracoccus versutus]MCJ1899159.1 acyl-CoA thioesterase [Paracoccus versutus]MDF3904143.1 acyl-CoA thioesterase [Paracoccus sp. AS002]
MGTETRMVEMIFPDAANHYGTLFGGNALALMAKAAFIAATRHAGGSVVMARSERVDFTTPIRVGEILDLTARVIRTGRSSMTVEVLGLAQATTGATERQALSGRFEMVAVDAHGRPLPIAQNITSEGLTHDHP